MTEAASRFPRATNRDVNSLIKGAKASGNQVSISARHVRERERQSVASYARRYAAVQRLMPAQREQHETFARHSARFHYIAPRARGDSLSSRVSGAAGIAAHLLHLFLYNLAYPYS